MLEKEMESCLPATFLFWAIPEIRKSLDKKISLFVFGENFLKQTNSSEPTNQAFLAMILVAV